ncbi:CBS domain [Rubrobacter radiotolerans]|uniref:CBS domain n=1 Tax=Rubrobacter radiotolerans TaxID=42256 RepID=A0A023X0U9_RUBRA|nr:CBS domain-containing protein [Rubrobacter radiotolerans]AHY45963.1 CBS domain [Rubrobacter radiotolerans]MDX5893376.1 CBS domain-containing protein [Rubrobacter radiotolerans]SMC03599.1 CBS domain-containing protein [Rubrobacter radiotolerans DSM 5868]
MEQEDIRRLAVRDVMHENWPALDPEATVEEAIKLFAKEGVSGAVVVESGPEGRRLVGIVTEGDLIFRDAEVEMPGFLDILGGMIPLGDWREYREETLKSAGVTVGQVMTRDVLTVDPDDTIAEAATLMADRRLKILPVVDKRDESDPENRTLRGVLTRMDILTLHILDPSP